jgi:hypothetical protein
MPDSYDAVYSPNKLLNNAFKQGYRNGYKNQIDLNLPYVIKYTSTGKFTVILIAIYILFRFIIIKKIIK